MNEQNYLAVIHRLVDYALKYILHLNFLGVRISRRSPQKRVVRTSPPTGDLCYRVLMNGFDHSK
jgi:hypothetical protein